MSASLVGSEMCIRDSAMPGAGGAPADALPPPIPPADALRDAQAGDAGERSGSARALGAPDRARPAQASRFAGSP
eukprot:8566206-Alexandrium_andersonii.AAC.1